MIYPGDGLCPTFRRKKTRISQIDADPFEFRPGNQGLGQSILRP